MYDKMNIKSVSAECLISQGWSKTVSDTLLKNLLKSPLWSGLDHGEVNGGIPKWLTGSESLVVKS